MVGVNSTKRSKKCAESSTNCKVSKKSSPELIASLALNPEGFLLAEVADIEAIEKGEKPTFLECNMDCLYRRIRLSALCFLSREIGYLEENHFHDGGRYSGINTAILTVEKCNKLLLPTEDLFRELPIPEDIRDEKK